MQEVQDALAQLEAYFDKVKAELESHVNLQADFDSVKQKLSEFLQVAPAAPAEAAPEAETPPTA